MLKINRIDNENFEMIYNNEKRNRSYTDLKMMYMLGKNKINEYATIVKELEKISDKENFDLDIFNDMILEGYNLLVITFNNEDYTTILEDYTKRLQEVTVQFNEVVKHIKEEHLHCNSFIEILFS